jgi:hypothetical protein
MLPVAVKVAASTRASGMKSPSNKVMENNRKNSFFIE